MLVVFILLLAQAPQQAPPRDAKPVASVSGGTIAGRVVDADTETPIDGAVVSISLMRGGDRPTPTEADERGMFQVTGLPPGDYRVTVSSPEHRPTHLSKVWEVEPHLVASPRPSVQLKPNEVRDDIVVRLERALAIEGRVVDEFGEPMADARMTIERLEGVGPSGSPQVPTDDRGLFRAYGLGPGTYRVCASPGFSPADPGLRGARGEVVERPYVRNCSSRVVLRHGNVPHVALTLSRVAGYAVSGRVTSESGREHLNVTLARADEFNDGRNFNADVKDGAFIALGVPPGEYIVHASATPAAPGRVEPELAIATIRVDASDVTGLVLVTKPGAIVSGQIVSESPLPAGLRLVVNRATTYKRSSAMFLENAVARADQTFELRGVHDPMVLAVGGLPRGWVMTSVRYRGAEVIDTLTAFASTTQPSELQITISARSAQLRVRPVDADGRLVEGARVMLLGAAGDRVALTQSYAREPAADGSLELPPVRPGEYVVVALRPGDALPRAGQAALLRQLGKPIVLTAGEPRTIDLAVITVPEGR